MEKEKLPIEKKELAFKAMEYLIWLLACEILKKFLEETKKVELNSETERGDEHESICED